MRVPDDSIDFLKELQRKQIVQKISIERCSRGKGRNLAYLLSSGTYLLSNIDMDVVYDPGKILLAIKDYHQRFEGKVLSVYGMMIVPRQAAEKLDGWKDLDRHEDNELALHAYELGLHAQNMSLNVVAEHIKDQSRNSLLPRTLESIQNFRDWFRIGMRFSDVPSDQKFHVTVPGRLSLIEILQKISQSSVFRMDKALSIRSAIWDGYPIHKNRLN